MTMTCRPHRVNNMNRKLASTQSGMTLIEVVVAMFVMTIGLLGLAGMQSTSIKDGLETAKRSQTVWLVTELVERMRTNPGGHPVGMVSAYENAAAAATACAVPLTQCADNANGPAATTCTPAQMATYDVWEVFCGNAEANVLANSSESLNLEGVTITCQIAGCPRGSKYDVAITWLAQTVGDSQTRQKAGGAALTDFETSTITMSIIP